ncbi:hypothetical protein NMY22_g9941 [Coprinellus aureogranulatus]|nr:hypothetical protein NMY22_g9941 [Coprinellus aureogranulatus]
MRGARLLCRLCLRVLKTVVDEWGAEKGKGNVKPKLKPVAKKTVVEVSGIGRAIDVDVDEEDEDEGGKAKDKGKDKGRLPAFLRLDSDEDEDEDNESLYLPSTSSKRLTNGAPALNDPAPTNDSEPFDDFYASDDEGPAPHPAAPQPHPLAQRSSSPQPQQHSPSLSPEFDPPPPRPSQRKSQSPLKGRVNLVPHECHCIEETLKGVYPRLSSPFRPRCRLWVNVPSSSNEPTPPSQNPTQPRRSFPPPNGYPRNSTSTLSSDPDPQPPTNTSRHANADGTLDVDAWRYDVGELEDDQLSAIEVAADTDLDDGGGALDEEELDAPQCITAVTRRLPETKEGRCTMLVPDCGAMHRTMLRSWKGNQGTAEHAVLLPRRPRFTLTRRSATFWFYNHSTSPNYHLFLSTYNRSSKPRPNTVPRRSQPNRTLLFSTTSILETTLTSSEPEIVRRRSNPRAPRSLERWRMKVIEVSGSSDPEVMEVRKEMNRQEKGHATGIDDEHKPYKAKDKGKHKGKFPAFLTLNSDLDKNLFLVHISHPRVFGATLPGC